MIDAGITTIVGASASLAGRSDRPSPADRATFGPAIDLAHLGRMTLGERSLEAEVLALFDRQADMLLARMMSAPPSAAAAFAHTLKGSARGIGAWRVGEAAAAVEAATCSSVPADLAQAVEQLGAAIGEAKAAIEKILAGG
jgi:HPt (histidine-containing phosphotransfer) domain-containing protein